MSWSEIKKAVNSNIDVPLNELMVNQKMRGLYVSSNPPSSERNYVTAISVTGKGLLYSLGSSAMVGNYQIKPRPWIKIKIDGETIANASAFHDSASNGNFCLGLSTLDMVTGGDGGNRTPYNVLFDYYDITSSSPTQMKGLAPYNMRSSNVPAPCLPYMYHKGFEESMNTQYNMYSDFGVSTFTVGEMYLRPILFTDGFSLEIKQDSAFMGGAQFISTCVYTLLE